MTILLTGHGFENSWFLPKRINLQMEEENIDKDYWVFFLKHSFPRTTSFWKSKRGKMDWTLESQETYGM